MSDRVLLALSFWGSQASLLFILGCHVMAAMALWRMVGRWGRLLTVTSTLLWIINFMRLMVQLRIFGGGDMGSLTTYAVRRNLLEQLCFWSVAGLLLALAVGWVLRQTLLTLAEEFAGLPDSSTGS